MSIMLPMPQVPEFNQPPDSYLHQTRQPLNNLVLVLPILLVYQALAPYSGTDVALLAPQYVQGVLRYFGATGNYLPALCIVTVLLIQQLLHRQPWKVQPKVIAGMLAESIIWTIPLLAVAYLSGHGLAGSMAAPPDAGLMTKILTSFGAGIYEEFVFRMVLISLLVLLLSDVAGLRRDVVTFGAVILAAILFSLCHYNMLGANEGFDWGSFVFRAIAGVLWGALFIYRGFGIAVGSHIVWDIYVLVFATPVAIT